MSQDDKGSYRPVYNLPADGARGRSRRRRIGAHRAFLRDDYRSFEQAYFAFVEVAASRIKDIACHVPQSIFTGDGLQDRDAGYGFSRRHRESSESAGNREREGPPERATHDAKKWRDPPWNAT
jgi:hypothetical protein